MEDRAACAAQDNLLFAARRWGDASVRVVLVVPLYRQAQFLVEAVSSALAQSLEETGVVIVNDGCPDPASHRLGTAFAASYPDRVAYIWQQNGGLPAARNRGVRCALGRWPETEAFFFLDADNLLLPGSIEAMYNCLNTARGVYWVYSTLELFGAKNVTWRGETPANLFRMLFENQADAGSLVHREVFEAGLYFDETMRQGYEDWEFFVRLLRNGYGGERTDNGKMLYRVKQQSMLTESQAKHEELVASIHDRHRDLLEPRRLTSIEHEHSPRFLLISPSGEILSTFTDPDTAVPFAPLQRRGSYWPPVLMVGAREAFQSLAEVRMLRGVLLVAQAVMAPGPVSFRFEESGPHWGIAKGGRGRPPHVLCIDSRYLRSPVARVDLKAASRLLRGRRRALVRIPEACSRPPMEELTADAVLTALTAAQQHGVFNARRGGGGGQGGHQTPARDFAWDRHCVKLDTTHPLVGSDRLHVAFAVPWLKFGGTDLCVIQLARAVRRLAPKASLHLVATAGGVEWGLEAAKVFDEMIFLGDLGWEKNTRLCDVVFRSMDLVIDTHSDAAYDSLSWRLKRRSEERNELHLSYLHVIDEARGRLAGFPSTAAKLAHGFDGFAVISENLRSYLINEGVRPSQVRVARNAPVVRPPTVEAARRLAAAKAGRLAAGERPLRLLFAGRADYQKGIARLKRMTEILVARGAPFELRFVGDANLRAESVEWPAGPIFTHPATYDEVQLASYYADADVCVLLSRWEGVPLSLLDAMAHGCVVVATDVGGVSELVEDGKNGLLLPNGGDEEVAAQAADLIGEILNDKTGSAAMRQEAAATAWRYSWDDAAKVFLNFLPDTVRTRHGLL
jgi:glycosyltransferase involved in cell wall biosynthesis